MFVLKLRCLLQRFGQHHEQLLEAGPKFLRELLLAAVLENAPHSSFRFEHLLDFDCRAQNVGNLLTCLVHLGTPHQQLKHVVQALGSVKILDLVEDFRPDHVCNQSFHSQLCPSKMCREFILGQVLIHLSSSVLVQDLLKVITLNERVYFCSTRVDVFRVSLVLRHSFEVVWSIGSFLAINQACLLVVQHF